MNQLEGKCHNIAKGILIIYIFQNNLLFIKCCL